MNHQLNCAVGELIGEPLLQKLIAVAGDARINFKAVQKSMRTRRVVEQLDIEYNPPAVGSSTGISDSQVRRINRKHRAGKK